ncbi:MAG: YrzE family protein [Lachnospiraceae bacterium]|nr:YrzE family protein [Lachnospiraceae bacterium]
MKIKQIIVSILFMAITSVLLLFLVSICTYIFKWQADMAMLLITFVYILTGIFGGMLYGKRQRTENGSTDTSERSLYFDKKSGFGKKLLQGIILGSVYMGILIFISVFGLQNTIKDYVRLMLLWILVVGGSVLGEMLFGEKA